MNKFTKRTSIIISAALLSLLPLTSLAQNYRILVSNDDGIDSPLIAVLKEGLEAIPDAEVVVVAPRTNQSGASQSSLGEDMRVEQIHRDGELFGYGVYGRPADAVRIGLKVLGADDPFDLVVSGINRGANVGDVSHLSGTVGAAMEGLYQGLPAIAVSQDVQGVDTEASARFMVQVISKLRDEGLPDGVMLSINIPSGEIKGVHVKPMGDSYLNVANYSLAEGDGATESVNSVYAREPLIEASQDESTDTWSYQQGYISITPLKFDWTAHEMIDELSSWGLSAD